jgi:hypothetical protein
MIHQKTSSAQDMSEYQVRKMTMRTSAGPQSIFYVYSPAGKIYSVTEGRHHKACSCPHYQKRLVGTLRTCKHLDLVAEFEAAQAPSTVEEHRAADAERLRRAQVRARMLQDFDCND